ncbi:MAG TPA: cupredoxin domain-containing protein [Anaerolineales bacterium]|nr:cupredoxin domain-containing protein [Anaerolineales bacterium]
MNTKWFVLVLFMSMVLAACGGGQPSTTIDVTMTDFQFTPNTFTVPAGQEITLNVLNNGAVVHNFVVMKLGTSAGEAFDDEDQANVFWEERDIPAGGDLSVAFTAPTEPGEYQVVCRTAGHIASGMVGKLVVVTGE